MAELIEQGPVYVSGADFSIIGLRADAFADGRLISIDFSNIGKAAYVNSKGVVISSRAELVVAHEFIHLGADRNSSGPSDPDRLSNSALNGLPEFDYDGPAVDFQNKVAREIAGFGENSTRVSYYAGFFYDEAGDGIANYYLDVGQNLTLNPSNPGEIRTIDIVRFGTSGSLFGVFTTDQADLIDTSTRQDASRDLLMGFGSNDTLRSGAGNDHLWGGEGDDTLDAGDGDDIVHGEDGDDTIIGGKGNDGIYGGQAGGWIGAIVDLQTDTLDYAALAGEVRFHLGSANAEASRPGNVSVRKGLGGLGTDTAAEIEKFVGTGYADSLVLDRNTDFAGFKDDKVVFDLGPQAKSPGILDTIFARDYATGLKIDLSFSSDQTIQNRATGDTISVMNAEGAYGTAKDDVIIGGNTSNELIGSDGADEIRGGGGSDRLVGGDKIDGVYTDDLKPDQLWGGAGADEFRAGDGDTIKDPDANDTIYVAGRLLTGGEETAKGSGVYKSANGVTYTKSGGAITVKINPEVTIENFRNGDAGIRLIDKEPDTDTPEERRDPLILDLDGDRNVVRELTGSFAYFDLDNDGFRERVAWTLAGDGLLARDLDASGTIDNGTELFGTGNVDRDAGVPRKDGAAGFAELSTLDSNGDGQVSADDTGFASLKVWQDANGDAVTDDGELKTLAELGIVSISLSLLPSNHLDGSTDGTEVTYRSDVTRSDGSIIGAYDAYLAINQYDSREIVDDVTIPAEFRDLPFVIGRGNLSDLDVAMARDPALEEMVREFAALGLGQVGEIAERVEAILLRWTGADTVAADSRGVNMNARWLEAIERISGGDFNQAVIGPNPRGDAAAMLIGEWRAIVSRMTGALLGQTDLGAQLTPGLSFVSAAFFAVDDGTTLEATLQSLVNATPAATGDAIAFWHAMAGTLNQYLPEFGIIQEQLHAAIDAAVAPLNLPMTAAQLLNAFFVGGASQIEFGAFGTGTQFHIAGKGVERLESSASNDVFVIGAGIGEVELSSPLQGSNNDQVWLVDANRSDVTISVDAATSSAGIDAEFLVSISTGDGTKVGFFSTLTTSGWRSPAASVRFANGEVVKLSDLISTQTIPYANSGEIVMGLSDSSVDIVGTANDDLLVGFGSNDHYIVGPGQGNDRIIDLSPANNDHVTVATSISDVRFSVTGAAGRDLAMTFLSTGEVVTIPGQFAQYESPVDSFTFSSGETLSAAQVRNLMTTGTPAGERIEGTLHSEVFDGKGGTDVRRRGQNG